MKPLSRKPTTLYKLGLGSLLVAGGVLAFGILLLSVEGKPIFRNFPVIVSIATLMGVFFFFWYSLQEPSLRNNFLRTLTNSFPWLPSIIGCSSVLFWYWYASSSPKKLESIQGAFFEVSAQVIPVLLLAIMIDVRRSEKLRSHDLVLTILALLFGEIITLQGAARGNGSPFDFAAVGGMVTVGFCAVIIGVILEFPSSPNEEECADD
jgi:hypothetical protein